MIDYEKHKHERGIVATLLTAAAVAITGFATGVGAALGGGALAMGIGWGVTGAGLLAAGWGVAKGIGAIFNSKTGQYEQPKQVQGTPQWEDAQAKAKEDQKRKRLQIADAGGTNLTSPMGLSAKAPIQQKTVLGQ